MQKRNQTKLSEEIAEQIINCGDYFAAILKLKAPLSVEGLIEKYHQDLTIELHLDRRVTIIRAAIDVSRLYFLNVRIEDPPSFCLEELASAYGAVCWLREKKIDLLAYLIALHDGKTSEPIDIQAPQNDFSVDQIRFIRKRAFAYSVENYPLEGIELYKKLIRTKQKKVILTLLSKCFENNLNKVVKCP